MKRLCRLLLFRLAAFLNAYKCDLKILHCSTLDRFADFSTFAHAFAWDSVEINKNIIFTTKELSFMTRMFYRMKQYDLIVSGWGNRWILLKYWKQINKRNPEIPPVPYKQVEKSFFYSQSHIQRRENDFSAVLKRKRDRRVILSLRHRSKWRKTSRTLWHLPSRREWTFKCFTVPRECGF